MMRLCKIKIAGTMPALRPQTTRNSPSSTRRRPPPSKASLPQSNRRSSGCYPKAPRKTRARVVGEIYRELDATLRSNPQFAAQLRDAFRSGSLDNGHQRAIVSLLTGRARQALPGVAKRVLNEWTSTIVSAAHERRTRQRIAERRVDIAGSGGAGNDGRRSMSPRDLDYARLTDPDILNL
jgi:hypothetical protein